MSRKPKRPEIAGLKPDGPWDARVCNYCFDLAHRRPRRPWRDHKSGEMAEGCPGCRKLWMPELDDPNAPMNRAAVERAAWDLLADQLARERAGVSTFEQAIRAVADLFENPNPARPEGKRARYCNVCFGLPHRRPPDRPCDGCGDVFACEVIPIATGLASTMAGIPELDSIA